MNGNALAGTPKRRSPAHNHVTRDVKPPGLCPGCDAYHRKSPPRATVESPIPIQLVPSQDIERIVGARRHPLRHIGRAVSDEQRLYIMHSAKCVAETSELTECSYSKLLAEKGLSFDAWHDWMDRPVVLVEGPHGLVPDRDAYEEEP
jgi:hypothetical protein